MAYSVRKHPFLTTILVIAAGIVVFQLIQQLYPLAFQAKDKTLIFLLAGQSNMAGRGAIPLDQLDETEAGIFTLSSSLKVVPAKQPVHWDKPYAAYSMAIDFARVIRQKYPDYAILLVPAAWGGSKISEWQAQGDAFLRAQQLIHYARRYGVYKGILWHHGETNAKLSTESELPNYANMLQQTLLLLRREIGDDNMPIIAGTLADYLADNDKFPNYTKINSQIRQVTASMNQVSLVDLSDLEEMGDRTHFSMNALKTMGTRYAATYLDKYPLNNEPN